MKNKLKDIEYNNLYPLFFTVIFILILIQYSFHSLDAIFYDLWVRSDIMASKPSHVVVVHMDEESDQFLGETFPYTYASHVRFLKRIVVDKPAVINYLIPMLEVEGRTEIAYQEQFKAMANTYVQNGGNFRFGTDKDPWGEQIPPEQLKSLGYSLALIHRDGNTFAADNVTRRAILNVSGEDSMHLWSANKFREQMLMPRKEATDYRGAYYNREADATFAFFRYGKNPQYYDSSSNISYHRVVVGNYPPGFFKGKIVLVGSKYVSNMGDFINTPYAKEETKSPKINVHAQIIQSFIEDQTIYALPGWISDLISVLLAFILSFIISRVQPTRGLVVTVGIMLLMFTFAYSGFVLAGYWLKLSHIILSIFVVYYIWVPFRAIGEYQTRYAIQEETKILKKVDRLKQNFISLMSHDLKTPVAKIAGITDILKTQYPNEQKQNELLQNITDSTKELNDFISSILDLTKIESRAIDLNKESRDVNTLVEAVIGKFRYEAGQQDMQIHQDLSPLYPISIDLVLIDRVLSNLLGNAIKYAGKGESIYIKTWDDESWVYIEIRDTGKGIKGEDLEHIFDKFYRVKNDDSHKIKGSGLGLYLVKYFIELHRGSISVTSIEGQGTAFTIKLENR